MDYKSLTAYSFISRFAPFYSFSPYWNMAPHLFRLNVIIRIIRNNYSQTCIFENGVLTA